MQLIYTYQVDIAGDLKSIDEGECLFLFANKETYDYLVWNLYHPSNKLQTLHDKFSMVTHQFYALSKGQSMYLNAEKLRNYHIAPYRISSVHMLSNLKLANELQTVLSSHPLLIQDSEGHSAVFTCVNTMAH